MRPLKALFILLALVCFLPPLPVFGKDGLLKVVVLSRHGVRAPTQDARVLALWSQKPWPDWPVAKGDLTPRGARLVAAMWSDLGEKLRKSGILPEGTCPGQVYVRADVDERTRATAKAILEGVAPGCGLRYVVAKTKVDPLFHPVKAGIYRYDAISVATDVLGMTQGGLDRLQDDCASALSLINGISGAPAPLLCSRFALNPKCQISDLPNAISVSADGTEIRLVGSLGIASSMTEIFLLEYGQWPEDAAGWGQVDSRVLGQIMPVHARVFDVVNRAPVVAWANGSSLLNEMTRALFDQHQEKSVNDAKLVVFVGHDTNIANVGALLGLDWQAQGYAPNGIPPAGALFLELWQRNGQKYVIVKFVVQPLDALHRAFNEDGAARDKGFAPETVMARIDGALAELEARAFRRIVARATKGAPVAPHEEVTEH